MYLLYPSSLESPKLLYKKSYSNDIINFTPSQEIQICNMYKNGLTLIQVANKFNLSFKPIKRILKKYNVIIRTSHIGRNKGKVRSDEFKLKISIANKDKPKSEIHKKNLSKSRMGIIPSNKLKINQENINKICDMYKNGNNIYEISKIFNISITPIKRILKENNIKTLNISEAQYKVWSNLERREKLSKTQKERYKDPKIIEINRQGQIKRFQNPKEREKIRQSKLHMFSALDHLVKDKYCPLWTKTLREEIRQRDGHICQNCGITQDEHKLKTGKKLPVHHVHYDKRNCYPDLITICNICNSKANFNKTYWESYYMNKLNDRQLLFWTKRNIK